MSKPNCYDCRHRRIIPGDTHSRCCHPEARRTGLSNNPIEALAEAFLGKANSARRALGVQGGGQTWPENFNPVFLTSCRGLEAKE